jgi:hypothetical protein
MTNVAGPEGAHSMSGEVRPKSGVDQGIMFTYSCPGANCSPVSTAMQATTVKNYLGTGYCYQPGQKQDADKTDRTVGCYCL